MCLQILRQPPRTWVLAAVLWLAMVSAVLGHQWHFWKQGHIDMDVMALLPHDEKTPAVDVAMRQLTDAVARQVVVLVGAPDWTQARAASQAFNDALAHGAPTLFAPSTPPDQTFTAALDFFRPWRDRLLTSEQQRYLETTPQDALTQQALRSLYQPAVQARVSDWAADPLGLWPQWWAERAAANHARPRDGMLWLAGENMEWVVLPLVLEHSAFRLSGEAVVGAALEHAATTARAHVPSARVLWAGVPLHAEAAAVQANREINTIGWGSLAGVLLLVWFAFRSLRPIALVGMSLIIGCAVALSVTVWCFGEVHLLTLVFGASLIGVAEDYGIHYFAARQDRSDLPPRTLMRHLLPGLMLALVTSALAYLVLGAAPFPGLRQMALFSATGLLAAMLTVVCWFPLIDRGTVPRTQFSIWIGASLARWPRLGEGVLLPSGARKISILLLATTLAVLALWGTWQLKPQDDVRQLQNASAALLAQQREIGQLLRMPSPAQFYLVQGATEDEVLQREEALKARLEPLKRQGAFAGVSAISDWVPSRIAQDRNAALTRQADTRVLAAVNTTLNEHLARPAFSPTPLTLQTWLAHPAAAPVRALWLGNVGGQFSSVIMLHGLQGVTWLPQLAAQAEQVHGVRWIDKPAEISALLERYRLSMTWLLALGHLLVLGVLMFRYGRNAWRAWLPTLFATIGVLAVLGWLGEPWQLFNVLALVLLLGVGVDYGIFLQERDGGPGAWLAVVVGAGSTWLSFGLLGLSSTPALRAFGLTLMIGLPLVLVLAPVLAPVFRPSSAQARRTSLSTEHIA